MYIAHAVTIAVAAGGFVTGGLHLMQKLRKSAKARSPEQP
jgi:hypothetical protein